jgi:Family of unknown function (DUF6812)
MDNGEHSVRVTVHAKGFWCEASVSLPKGGYRGRVNDLLNSDTQFLALTDVLLYREGEESTEEPVSYDVLLVRKGEIEFVVPLDDSW